MPKGTSSTRMIVVAVSGALVIVVAWYADIAASGLPLTPWSLVEIHKTNPLLWPVLFLPLYLIWTVRLLDRVTGLAEDKFALKAQLATVESGSAHTAQLVANIFDAVLLVDERGAIVASNPTAETIFGYSAGELSALPITDLLPDLGTLGESNRVLRRTARHEVITTEWHLEARHKTGSRFPIALTYGSFDLPTGTGVCYVIRDDAVNRASEHKVRRKNEKLVAARDAAIVASQSKSAFMANMSHRLRTPLNAIIGYAELVAEETADLGRNHLADDLLKIGMGGQELLALINNIIDMSMIETGRIEIISEVIRVQVLLEDVLRSTSALAEKRGNRLVPDTADDQVTVDADPRRVRQILINLLNNALKSTSDGIVKVELNKLFREDQYWVEFIVSDDGSGMTPEEVERYLGGGASSGEPDDTSLGLRLSQRFARMMGGDLSIRSQKGTGTVVTLSLPSGTKPTLVPTQTYEWRPSDGDENAPQILIVDIDPSTADAVAPALKIERAEFESANNTEGCLQALDNRPQNAIILATDLEDDEGWALLATLRAHPIYCFIPVIAVSSLDDGAQAYRHNVPILPKPLNADKVRALVRQSLLGAPSPRILVIEERDGVRETMCAAMSRAGWTLTPTANAVTAIELMLFRPPDLVLVGGQLGEMDPFELVTIMRGNVLLRSVPTLLAPSVDLDEEELQRLSRPGNRILERGTYTDKELPQRVLLTATAMLRSEEEPET